MQRQVYKNAGFTLLELMLVLGLIGILGVSIGSVSYVLQRSTCESKLLATLHNDMRYALDALSYQLRMASSLSQATTGDPANPNLEFTVRMPFGSDFKFGYNASKQSIWVNNNSHPICSQVEKLELKVNGSLVEITLTSVSQMPGVSRGLPIITSTTVRMRNQQGG